MDGCGDFFTIHGGADDSSGIARPFAAGVEVLQLRMTQCFRIPGDAYRRRCAAFSCYYHGLFRQISPHFCPEGGESLLQRLIYEGWEDCAQFGGTDASEV